MTFADAAADHPEFAREFPRFLAAIWRVFNEYEIAGYVASRKPRAQPQRIVRISGVWASQPHRRSRFSP
jgi:hypothetical protein